MWKKISKKKEDQVILPTKQGLFSTVAARSVYQSTNQSVNQFVNSQTTGSADEELTPVFKTPAPDGPYRDEIVKFLLNFIL